MTDRLYLWRIRKRTYRVHIENPETERAFCQVEKCGGKTFDGRGETAPPGREICRNCLDLAERPVADYREPDVRVLMGERLAEVEPELFASIETSGPWKRHTRMPQGRRAKGHKAKRSKVKYERPFDDPLPW